MLYIAMITAFAASIIITPLVIKFAYKIGAIDKPNHRKVHVGLMPRIGGLAIFTSFLIGYAILQPVNESALGIIIGACIIIFVGFLDDMLDLTAKAKLIGQLIAAIVVIWVGDLQIEFINLPIFGQFDFGYFSIPITILWILGITNAVNLIDGLDGLAAGVSIIALISISAMAFIMGNYYVMFTASILAASTLGFLIYNFYPAKIFIGDTGALFLGFMMGVLALLGFKNVAVVSLIIPIIMLGVPISDTVFAIVRRVRLKQPISMADNSHLHHCLLRSGFSHRQAVLVIYGIAILFGIAAVLFSQATVWGGILLIGIILTVIEIFVEIIGLAGNNYRPLLNLMRLIVKCL